MIAFECRWVSGQVAVRLNAPDATQAGQEAAGVMAELYAMGRPLVLASNLLHRMVGLHNPVTGELAAIVVPRPARQVPPPG